MSSSTVLTIDGTDYDASGRASAKMLIDTVVPVAKDGTPELSFYVHSSVLKAYANGDADPFLTREVRWKVNGTTYFAGDIRHHVPVKDEERKWAHHYTALGLRYRGERIPVRDDNTGTDKVSFNLPFDDPDYIASRAGRTTGQCILGLLEMATNSANLKAAGLGGYTTGSGASASCAVVGGAVQTPTIDAGGSGYDSADPPSVVFVGGGLAGNPPTRQATGHANVSGGVVTGITIDDGGDGYTAAPSVIVSTLPAATINDLAAMDVIPPYPIVFNGERIFQAIEAAFKAAHPNHQFSVEPDGTFRFRDIRDFGGTSCAIAGDGRGALAAPVVSPEGVVTGLHLVHGGSGYTSATVTISGDGGSGATATATVTDGEIAALTLGSGGSGYPEGRTLNLVLGEHLVEAPQIQEDISGCYGRVEADGRPIIEANEFHLGDGSLEEYFDHDGLTDATTPTAKGAWKYADVNQPSVSSGAAVATATLATTGIDATITVTNQGSGFTSAPTITFSGGGGTGAAATATVSGGKVTSIARTAAGSGYSTAPTVNFSLTGTGGTGVTATCQLQTRGLRSPGGLSLLDGGYGYGATAPIVSFSGGTGTGIVAPTAHTTLTADRVTAIAADSLGSGYLTPPTVHIGGPGTPSTDYGTCDPAHNTTTTIRITSDDATRTFEADSWAQQDGKKKGVVILSSSTVTGLLSKTIRRVTANTAMAAGGTCDVTVDRPLDHVNYDSYSLYGTSGGARVVWCRYRPTDPDIRAKVTDQPFTFPFPYINSDGLSITMTTEKACYIQYSSSGAAPYQQGTMFFDIDATAGTFTTTRPTVSVYGTPSKLAAGGSNVDGIPADVRFLVGVYKSNNKSVYPADSGSPAVPQYAGTYHDLYGQEDTLFLYVPEWRDNSNQANMDRYTREQHASVSDVIYEGNVTLIGMVEPAFLAGLAVNIAGDGFDTPWSSLGLPAARVEVQYHADGPLPYTVSLGLSNRRAAGSTAKFLAPPQAGFSAGGGGLGMGGGMGVGGSMTLGGPMTGMDTGGFGGGMGSPSFGGGMAPMMPMPARPPRRTEPEIEMVGSPAPPKPPETRSAFEVAREKERAANMRTMPKNVQAADLLRERTPGGGTPITPSRAVAGRKAGDRLAAGHVPTITGEFLAMADDRDDDDSTDGS